MAIDRIKKVTIIGPATSIRRLMRAIHRLGAVEVVDVSAEHQAGQGVLRRHETSTEQADEKLRKVNFILGLLDAVAPEKEGFFAGLTPLPLVVEQDEVDNAVQHFDLEGRFEAASDLDEVYRNTERTIGDIQSQLEELTPLADLPFSIRDATRTTHTRLVFGHLPGESVELLASKGEPWSRVAWEVVKPAYLHRKDVSAEDVKRAEDAAVSAEQVRLVFVFLPDDEDGVRKALASIGFESVPLPDLPAEVRDHVRELKGDLAVCQERKANVAAKIQAMAGMRRELVILKAYWQSNRERELAAANSLQGKWLHILCGRIRAQDVGKLESIMQRDFPESMIIVDDPAPDEEVPVSLSLPWLVRPLELLVEMFGLPHYQTFDPSPFLLVNFYVFFGICFSDVGYGLMLVLFSAYLASRTKEHRGVRNFARILLHAGCSTVVFGALLGSWFGDLYKPEYLGEGNALLWVQQKLLALDPMDKPVMALALALSLGMINQFYGIVLKAYGALRRGDWATAVCDGLFWLVTLPGLVIMATKLFMSTPPAVFRLGVWLFLGGALGLILTQGRGAKNPIARLLLGVVSLYGIVGSYGCTAFIGDTLSYGRLLALGLTTSIVAQTFNMIAGMAKGVPGVGIVLFIALLIVGHVFNFMISLLGAFVHSMRLIYVEFFGRFYEGGARPFRPLGFDSPACIVRKRSRAR